MFTYMGRKQKWAEGFSKASPFLVVIITATVRIQGNFFTQNLDLVGAIKVEFPIFTLPIISWELMRSLLMPTI